MNKLLTAIAEKWYYWIRIKLWLIQPLRRLHLRALLLDWTAPAFLYVYSEVALWVLRIPTATKLLAQVNALFEVVLTVNNPQWQWLQLPSILKVAIGIFCVNATKKQPAMFARVDRSRWMLVVSHCWIITPIRRLQPKSEIRLWIPPPPGPPTTPDPTHPANHKSMRTILSPSYCFFNCSHRFYGALIGS